MLFRSRLQLGLGVKLVAEMARGDNGCSPGALTRGGPPRIGAARLQLGLGVKLVAGDGQGRQRLQPRGTDPGRTSAYRCYAATKDELDH